MNEYVIVTVVNQKGSSALVEYVCDGLLNRVYIPTTEISEGRVLKSVLAQGIPYGFPWEELDLKFDVNKFADELHQVGIWTQEDALRSPKKVSAALHATLAVNLSEVLNIAKGVHHE